MNSNAVWGGIIAAAIAVAGIVGFTVLNAPDDAEVASDEDAPTVADATPDADDNAVAPTVPDDAQVTSDDAEEGATEAATATPVATPDVPDPVDSAAPVFDVVRVDAGGNTVIAGRARANQNVVLRLDGDEVATTKTDAAGNFVSLFDVPTADVPRILTAETVDEDGTLARAEDSIIIAPTFPTAPATETEPTVETAVAEEPTEEVTAATDAEAPVAEEATADASSDEPTPETDATTVAEAPAATTADEPAETASGETIVATADAQPATVSDIVDDAATPAAPPVADEPAPPPVLTAAAEDAVPRATPPRLFRAGPSGVTVLDATPTSPPEVAEDLGIDAISYDEDGDVQLSGRGLRDTELRIYLNNRPIQIARVDQGGTWTSPLSNVDTGVYTLRIDAVAEDGSVTSRIETPFERTAPDIAAQLRREGVSAITVQPGYTLWAISEGYFGEGVQYVQIFEANREQIRDPDLIFPGQVFALPEPDAPASEN